MGRLQDRHIVVTGASAGIGAELCRELGREGCRVTLAARRAALLEEVAAEVRRSGGKAEVIPADVTRREDVIALAQQATETLGQIDVWVNNAGAGIAHRLLEATDEDMLAQYRLNCLSALYAYQALLPAWLRRGYGQIIDVCSLGGKAGYAFAGGYAAAKHALSAIGDTLRQELALSGALPGQHKPHHGAPLNGIVVTTVYPGPTVSDFGKARLNRLGEGGAAAAGFDVEKLKRSRNLLVANVAGYQPTRAVVRAIVRAMLRPVYVVYPHRWATLAVLLGNLFPGQMLRLLNRVK
jgi:short-subunit dehydrogenase